MKRHFLAILSTTLIFGCGSNHNSTEPTSTWSPTKPQEEQSPDQNLDQDIQIPTDILNPPLLTKREKTISWQGPKLNPSDKTFLRLSQKENELLIEGLKISIDSFDSQDLYKSLNNRSDIKKVTIHCEVFELQRKLNLPGVDLEIKAKDFFISKEGTIDLTPNPINTLPPQFQDGRPGQRGAKLVINVENLQYPQERNTPLFILKGGNGQPAGAGQNGRKGRDAADLGGGVVQVIRLHRGEPMIVQGTYQVPTRGHEATPGGRPGLGGPGGLLLTNITVPSKLVDLSGGDAGKAAPTYFRGQNGSPNPFYIINERNQKLERRLEEPEAFPSPKAEVLKGTMGKTVVLEKETWVTEGYLEFSQRYFHHLYKNNHIQDAKVENQKVFQLCSKLKEENIFEVDFQKECQSSTKSAYQLMTQTDFYGNAAPWTPNLSLETNYQLFNEEIEKSFRLLYLTYWSLNKSNDLDRRIEGINEQQKEIESSVHQTEKAFNKLELSLPEIKNQIEDIKQDEITFELELKKTEEEILKVAQRNVEERNRTPFFKKALKSLAAISRVIPAGQPALGAAATTLSTIVDSFDQEQPTSYLLKNLPDHLKGLTPSKITSSLESWESLRRDVSFDEYKRIFSLTPQNSELNEEEIRKIKKDYLKKVEDFAAPIASETLKQLGHFQTAQVSRSEIDWEIQKIKASHPLFRSLTSTLQKLVSKREKLSQKVAQTQRDLLNLTNKLSDSYLLLGELSEAKLDLSQGMDRSLKKVLSTIETEQVDRLDYYLYLFRKAYQYRALEAYPSLLDSHTIVEKIKKLALKSDESRLSTHEFLSLQEAYAAQVSQVVESIVQNYQRHYSATKFFQLSQEQIQALNQGHEIYLNLGSTSLLGALDVESVRINKMTIADMDLELIGMPETQAEATLSFESLGTSKIKKGNQTYTFSHQDPKKWGARVDLLNNAFSPIKTSTSDNSLFRVITGSTEGSLLFTRLGGLSYVKVKLDRQSNGDSAIVLRHAQIEIDYDYQEK